MKLYFPWITSDGININSKPSPAVGMIFICMSLECILWWIAGRIIRIGKWNKSFSSQFSYISFPSGKPSTDYPKHPRVHTRMRPRCSMYCKYLVNLSVRDGNRKAKKHQQEKISEANKWTSFVDATRNMYYNPTCSLGMAADGLQCTKTLLCSKILKYIHTFRMHKKTLA